MEIIIDTQTEYHPRGSGPALEETFDKLTEAYKLARSVAQGNPIYWVAHKDVEVRFWFVVGDGAMDFFQEEWYESGEVAPNRHIETWWNKVGYWGFQPWTPRALSRKMDLDLQRKDDGEEWDIGVSKYKLQIAYDKAAMEAWERGDFDTKPTRQVWNEISKKAGVGFAWEV